MPWPCNPANKYIVHFPEAREIWCFGSGYGGNALLGKKCLALRIASVMGRDEGWLAEHMLILGVTSPAGEKTLRRRGVSQRVRQDQFRDADSAAGFEGLEGDDDRRRHRLDQAAAPTATSTRSIPKPATSASRPGTSYETNPNAMETLRANVIFTNVALTDDGDVWWEGMTKTPPAQLTDWQGKSWTPGCGRPAAHPNARFTVAGGAMSVARRANGTTRRACRSSAFIFGGAPLGHRAAGRPRRATGTRASTRRRRWARKPPPRQPAAVGEVRRDPFAMLPFCGYHIGDYFPHWLDMGRSGRATRRGSSASTGSARTTDGKFVWPGFGENMRVLKWIVERCGGTADAAETPLGFVPRYDDLDWRGIEFDARRFSSVMDVDPSAMGARARFARRVLRAAWVPSGRAALMSAAGSACGPDGGVIQLYI